MALIKCKECGHDVSDKAEMCPNCGCPASEFVSSIIQELDSDLGGSTETDNVEQKQNEDISDYDTFKKNAKTTDTGYQHEKLLQGYATFLFAILIIVGVVLWLSAMFMAYVQGSAGGYVAGFFGGPILFLSLMALAHIIRAFLMIYANISTNLHEINMKLR